MAHQSAVWRHGQSPTMWGNGTGPNRCHWRAGHDIGKPQAPDLYGRGSGAGWPLPLKLNVTLLGDRRLFNRDHLSLHLGEFGRRLPVAAHKACGRPENDDRCSRDDRSLVC
jgi:hypothetical protein